MPERKSRADQKAGDFEAAARAAECDEDEARFAERLKKVATAKKEGGGPAKDRRKK